MAVLPLDGFAIDRQCACLDIKQPDLGNSVARVERKFDIAVVFECGVGNLDDQQDVSGCRVSVRMVGPFDEGDVRLRFAQLVEDDGVLHPHHMVGGRTAAEALGETVDNNCMPAAYPCHIHQFSIDQLDSVGLIQQTGLGHAMKLLH